MERYAYTTERKRALAARRAGHTYAEVGAIISDGDRFVSPSNARYIVHRAWAAWSHHVVLLPVVGCDCPLHAEASEA